MRLLDELRAWASGDYGIEAAVELLAAHGTWPHRRDFRDACIHATAEHLVADFDLPQVWLDFEAAAAIAEYGRLPASGSELQVLAVAAELAGYPSGRPFGDLLRGLDRANTTHVLNALAHAAGRPRHLAKSCRRCDTAWHIPKPVEVNP